MLFYKPDLGKFTISLFVLFTKRSLQQVNRLRMDRTYRQNKGYPLEKNGDFGRLIKLKLNISDKRELITLCAIK
ncbi:hypothetical protein HNQ81_001411 [Desulfoprunum benzoelyticum]|uniref:Uncharacterized protein n=1 Tax=Desulfoprunum benzoelyticum TaxID=1506996 RepID=A0A840UN47_9BACT|nr:hypothetical protein [Desulfoprunum benzoelyticum]MBB5347687.1 hypothetical protein [Desulfoprunum benzoelyticum]